MKYKLETELEVQQEGRAWAFDADGNLFKLTLETLRIGPAYLFEHLLAVTSKQSCEGPYYIHKPFTSEPDWHSTSVNYDTRALIEMASE